ncbi:unnamed protein product [Mytilus coruscus]|uniref:Integrase catalytic domain-containing protein n=1 Tax=Mytilus coruscus TaxID=42192 RepID=A0A6J8E7D0_MYTCO|nr:unnamed protein product [Mytilus coruscus]
MYLLTKVVQNIDIVNSCVTPDLEICSDICSNEHIEKVKDQFTLSDHLSESQQTELASLLYKNIDLFVTDDNPNLGYTKLIEHTIRMKPDATGKHQKPYRLPPYKREILRHHLDKLLKQGIISPVSETEDLPITSPIVLVTKRSTSSDQHAPQNFRFCCDFRYLNSQTQEFKYTTPNLQALTKSFSEMTLNYITSIDLSSGFFQMGITPESSQAVQAIHVSTEEQPSEHSDPYDADTDEPQDGNKQFKIKRQRILHESSKSDTDIDIDKMVNDKILAKISMPINNIKELQRQDPSLSPIIDYLENDILPDLQKEARCVLLKSNDYALIDGILFHSRVAKSKRNKMMSHYQIGIPRGMIPSVLKVVHDSPLGGHAGMNNTLDRAKEHFFFPRMGKIITDYVQTCHFCQVRKVTNFKTKQAVVAFPTPSEPFEVWQIDLCGPFPKSVNGNTYVFTAVDMFSKFIFAHPLRNNDALTVCEDRLEIIWEMIVQNAKASGEKMEENANFKLNELKLSIGDYVYLQRTLTGQGTKFQPLYDRPFVVNSIPSPHLIKLRDPSGKRKIKSPVHINRLKLAHIRAPDPQNQVSTAKSSFN